MPRTTSRLAGDRSRLGWAAVAALLLAYAAAILGARQPPPTVDYPDWVYQGVLFGRVLAGHPIAGYALKRYPVPNSLTTVALGAMDLSMPWEWAAKVWVCLYLLLAFAAARAMARACGNTDWRLAVTLPTVLFLNLDFWYGHVGFEIGVCLLLLLAAALLRGRSTAVLASLLTVMWFAHMEACACGLLLLGVWWWRERGASRPLAALPAAALTAWYTVGRYATGNIDGRSVAPAASRYGSPTFLLYKLNSFLKVFGYVNARDGGGASQTEAIFGRVPFVLLAGAGCCLALLCLALLFGRGERESWLGDRGTLRWCAVGLAGMAVVMPQVVLGVADPGSRLLLAAAALGFFAVPWRRPTGSAVAALSMLLGAVNLLQFARIEANPRMRGAPKDVPGLLLGLAHVEPGERLAVYGKLRRGQMDERVFQTGMFRIVPCGRRGSC